jgi:hypothetical protein
MVVWDMMSAQHAVHVVFYAYTYVTIASAPGLRALWIADGLCVAAAHLVLVLAQRADVWDVLWLAMLDVMLYAETNDRFVEMQRTSTILRIVLHVICYRACRHRRQP